jgi:hypothetical protein
MHPPEDDEYAHCADCNTEVSIFDRVYPMGDGRTLCFDCARGRAGVYHDVLERWTVSPQLSNLV